MDGTQAETMRRYIVENITLHPVDIVAITVQKFNVTRTTVHRHLNHLLKQGKIIKSGTTRNIKYALKTSLDRRLSYVIQGNLSEFDVLQHDFRDIFKRFSENIDDVCVYGFTEIVNNAIEHSKGTEINVSTWYINEQLFISIQDNGIGVFKSIHDYFKLSDPRESVFQLTKGKMTTDPTNHTGEGIFFTSRAFDHFEIYANNLHYFRNNIEQDWALETIDTHKIGSTICMSIKNNALINLVELFKQYQDPESLAFNRTDIIVELSRFGNEPFISRSQAKRVILGLDNFQQITLDFSGVRLVGQGFVDEVFRVFKLSHPTITINYIHANNDVTFMIKRGLATTGSI
ncbi:MAG: DUF4325 domain-containing protein [Gammaproteobacteria bacterium]|nr:DUF4325 domain-containing protein [Gammaproteobacteria bacterium]